MKHFSPERLVSSKKRSKPSFVIEYVREILNEAVIEALSWIQYTYFFIIMILIKLIIATIWKH